MNIMKRQLVSRFFIALCAFSLVSFGAAAQTLQLIYVAPTPGITTAFGAQPAIPNMPANYSGVVITAANQAAFNGAASPNMLRTYQQLQPGQALRTRLDAMMQISNGVVTNVSIFLVDDRTGLGTGSNAFYTSTQGSTVYVWPAASNWPSGAPNAWVAQISVGELAAQRFITSGGWPAWETVLIHESLHTQFTGEHMKWGSTSIVYGGDHMHY